MKSRRRYLAAVAASVGIVACAPAGATDTPEASVLRLELAQCHNGNEHRATAFAIDDGLAITVAHAFEDIDGFTVRTSEQQELSAEVVYLDVERDIAVLELSEASTAPPLTLRIPENDEIAEIATFAEIEGVVVKDAEVLRYVRLTLDGVGDRAGIEISADITTGDSGGPLLDEDGRVIGMVFATSRRGERGWAISTSEIQLAVDGRQDRPVERPCADR